MNPIVAWVADHFALVLAIALSLSAAVAIWGAIGAWRAGRWLGRSPRPIVRFVLALVATAAGLGGIVLFSSGLVRVAPVARQQSRMIGEPAPPLAFTWVADGAAGRLADFQGQVVLVNVWATWCPPCREEMPALERLQKSYGARGLVVLHVSDEDRETIAGYLADEPMSTRHAVAQPIPWPEFGRPTSFVIDRRGMVREVMSGARDFAGFEREIRDLL